MTEEHFSISVRGPIRLIPYSGDVAPDAMEMFRVSCSRTDMLEGLITAYAARPGPRQVSCDQAKICQYATRNLSFCVELQFSNASPGHIVPGGQRKSDSHLPSARPFLGAIYVPSACRCDFTTGHYLHYWIIFFLVRATRCFLCTCHPLCSNGFFTTA